MNSGPCRSIVSCCSSAKADSVSIPCVIRTAESSSDLALVDARKVANKIESEREKAVAYHDTVAPKMEEIRYQIDKLELLVADELWTLPKYRELLFIR